MQRENKYRAYDKRTKELIEILGFKYVGKKHIQLYYKDLDGDEVSCVCDKELIELMQYTGLKDKNGKEIYERDILKVDTGWYKSSKNIPNREFDSNIKGITYWSVEHKVFSSEVGFRIYGIDRRFNKILTPNMIFNNNAEVVGTIYENPELLQEVEK